MGETSSSHVPVIVAAITVIGTISAATIANWDKIFPDSPAGKATPAVPEPAANEAVVAKDVPSEEKRPAEVAKAAEDLADDAGASGGFSIDGVWQDDYGIRYQVEQDGARYSYIGYQGVVPITRGEGRVSGRVIRHAFETSNDAGECEGKVAEGDRLVFGQCVNVYKVVTPFRIRR